MFSISIAYVVFLKKAHFLSSAAGRMLSRRLIAGHHI